MHWGDFRDDGCIEIKDGSRTKKVRRYAAILWDIPAGESWEDACKNMPADINGIHFDHPTLCVKSNATDVYADILKFSAKLLNIVPSIAGALVGKEAIMVSKVGAVALNMWGVFLVDDGSCK